MPVAPSGLWVERLTLTNFRNYATAVVETDAGPQVIAGANGSGKTNLLEAVSLLAPGQGLRRAPFRDLARTGAGGDGSLAVSARAHALAGPVDIGTGLGGRGGRGRAQRQARAHRRQTQSGSGVLADYLEMVWVTPAMDGLFTGPASERRRFLDRLILCFDPGYRTIAGRFERAMQPQPAARGWRARQRALSGFELVMAETGVAVAAARVEAVAAMAAIVDERRTRNPNSAFPWASFRLEGRLKTICNASRRSRSRMPMRERCATCVSATAQPGARSTVRTAPICSSSMGRRHLRRGSARRANRRRC